jgi:hypothetical protein
MDWWCVGLLLRRGRGGGGGEWQDHLTLHHALNAVHKYTKYSITCYQT